MFRTEVQDIVSKQRAYISFFPDDTIETVRSHIAVVANSHPDRLFVLVGIQRPSTFYKDDPRHWESLFHRLSYGGKVLLQSPFQEYQTEYRSPATSLPFQEYGLEEWMTYPDALSSIHSPSDAFKEYYILGTEEVKSYILPYEYDSSLIAKIPAAVYPIPQNTFLMTSIYKTISDIKDIKYRIYDESAETVQGVYFPFYRTVTPTRLSDDTIALLQKTSHKLDELLKLSVPEPTALTILRTRFHVPFVDTDFGNAIRTRFEQMFFGLTVSKKVPYIGFFTSNSETTRHKFFVEDEASKRPLLNMSTWHSWWTTTRPARNRPTLILYRGKTAQHFDRIAITSTDMILSTYRPEGNTQTLDELKTEMSEWLKELDSILPFIDEKDIVESRWDLQDMSLVAKYKKKLDEYDLRRFSCISFLFDMTDANTSTFRLLRSDHSVDGLTSLEIKVLQMLRNKPTLSVTDIQTELDIPAETARKLLQTMELRANDEPDLLTKNFKGFPTLRIGVDTLLIASIDRIDLPIQYANILRYIVSDPSSKELDAICPKRMERVQVEAAAVQVQDIEVDQAILDEYADVFGYLEGEEATKEEPVATILEEAEEEVQKIQTKQTRNTLYNYFNTRLQSFDPETFSPIQSEYPKKCEQKHQPIILNSEDLERLEPTAYDPRKYMDASQLMMIENPNGVVICPEYWCIRDEIPLQETQLINEDGFQRCPMCKGKVKQKQNDNPREFTVISRDKAFKYPGLTNYKSPKNGRVMPCCYRTPESGKTKTTEEKYYVLTETKTNLTEYRCAKLPKDLIASLYIDEKYELYEKNNRIQKGMAGYFRTGLGRPSETLSTFLGLKTAIPSPKDSIETILKCSFFTTWRHFSDKDVDAIRKDLKAKKYNENLARIVAGINEAYERKELTILQELEYVSIFLQCDVFRVLIDKRSLGCMFYSPVIKGRTRGIIVLQWGDEIYILSHVSRVGNSLTFKANIFQPPFRSETSAELEKLRNVACSTSIPTYMDAVKAIEEIAPSEKYSIILDPYGRAQALYIPGKVVLPFAPAPVPADPPTLVEGYESIQPPEYYAMREYIDIAAKHSPGYEWREDVSDLDGYRMEMILKSGLRVPTDPDDDEEVDEGEIIQTVKETTEDELAFGSPDADLKQLYSDVSYASEVFDFLLFELSNTLKEKYPDLRNALQASQPKRTEIEPLLKEWFESATHFTNITTADKFVTKIREPCGQFKSKETCTGNVCGWNGNTCKVQIKNTLKKDAMFQRLLSTMVDNVKLRGMVLEGRSTPFFSTILYIELPHELIVTDNDLTGLQ